MSLSEENLKLFNSEVIPKLQKRKKVISLGYPEITNIPGTQRALQTTNIISTYQQLADFLGFEEAITIDFSAKQRCDIVHDLNYQVEDERLFGADLIIDPGTVEHCFNIAQVFKNIKDMLRTGGVVWHNNPANWVNHGFYNMSPCVYYDFYGNNGFGDIKVFLRDSPISKPPKIQPGNTGTEILPQKRFIYNVVAVKKEEVPFTYPIQYSYSSKA